MKISESQREFLRLVGAEGGNYWDVANDWQSRRHIPYWLWQPSVTFSRLDKMGLLALDGERLRLTELGREQVSRDV